MRRGRRALVALVASVGLIAGGVLAAAPSANATAAWSITPSPSPAGTRHSSFNSVSCPTPTICFAVGFASPASVPKGLVERWNGTSWSVMPSPAMTSELRAVTCPSAKSCFALAPSDPMTFVAHWNGAKWSRLASPETKGANVNLGGVTCRSATDCFAVGASIPRYHAAHTWVQRWNGKKWSKVTSPNAGRLSNELVDVSCPSATSCFAVGDASDGGKVETLVEHWNGTKWSIVASPNPKGGFFNHLAAVACAGPKNCFAVGSSATRSGPTKTLVERWNGTKWSIVKSPSRKPATANQSTLVDVSCPSARSCTAVGNSIEMSGLYRGEVLVERWNGATWSMVNAPSAPGANTSELHGVTCRSPMVCFTVGSSWLSPHISSLIERYR